MQSPQVTLMDTSVIKWLGLFDIVYTPSVKFVKLHEGTLVPYNCVECPDFRYHKKVFQSRGSEVLWTIGHIFLRFHFTIIVVARSKYGCVNTLWTIYAYTGGCKWPPPLEKIGDKLNEKGTITVKQIRCLKKKILGVTANFFCSKKKKKKGKQQYIMYKLVQNTKHSRLYK